jgi:hypothetical protein
MDLGIFNAPGDFFGDASFGIGNRANPLQLMSRQQLTNIRPKSQSLHLKCMRTTKRCFKVESCQSIEIALCLD